jgi:hypothetical protein
VDSPDKRTTDRITTVKLPAGVGSFNGVCNRHDTKEANMIRIECRACENRFRLCPTCASCDQLNAALSLVVAAFLNGCYPNARHTDRAENSALDDTDLQEDGDSAENSAGGPEETVEALERIMAGVVELIESTGRKVYTITGPVIGPDGRWRYEHAA